MYEIELKAHVRCLHEIERMLTQCADFSFECTKKDSYWDLNQKTIRIREECQLPSKLLTVFVTNKIKSYCHGIEVNKEIEFELASSELDSFIAMLKNFGFKRILQKNKHTKIYIPHRESFSDFLLHAAQHFSIELSAVPPLGSFLEIELLYPEYASECVAQSETSYRAMCIRNAEKILFSMLDMLNIDHAAIESRSYAELLKDSGSRQN